MADYLYALVEGLPAKWRAPASGVGGAAVVARRFADLTLISASMDVVPPATPRTLAVHHDVVATALEARALLPFRYGTIADAADFGAWLATRRPAVDDGLARVRGCVEMTVKLLRLDCSVTQHATGRALGAAAPGERELKVLGERLIAYAGLTHSRYRPAGSGGNVAASIAFLVPRAEMPAFLARIAPIATRATGVAVVPTGPWPAYSFVPSFDRLPLAHAETAFLPGHRQVG